MARINWLGYARLVYLSQPAGERGLYRQVARLKPRRILEIGLGMGIRSHRLLQVAGRYRPAEELQYTGIDLFEGRPERAARMTMKAAYKLLRGSGARIKLVPGDVLGAMTRTANEAPNTDLILIDGRIDDQALQDAWRYFPRMLHAGTLVLRQVTRDGQRRLERLSTGQINALAHQNAASTKSTASAPPARRGTRRKEKRRQAA